MMNAHLDNMLVIADIHIKLMCEALTKVSSLMPLNTDKIRNLTYQEFLSFELLGSRFSKLQDYMESKIFDAFLTEVGENVDRMIMLDKIHKLERLEIVPSPSFWEQVRDLRNHLAHEYPDHPELTAKYLNDLLALVPDLLACLECLKAKRVFLK